MIAAAILQTAYNDLYKQLRNYIWDYETVVKLADLEVATYMTFPDIDRIRFAFNKLKSDVQASDIWSDDKLLQKAIDSFEDKLDGADQLFYELIVPEEVKTTETAIDIDEEVVDDEPDMADDIDIKEEDEYDYQEESDSEQGTEDTEE